MQTYLIVMALGLAVGTIGSLVALSRPSGSHAREILGFAVVSVGMGIFIIGTLLT